MQIWVIEGDSESGDHYLALFKKKPNDKTLKTLVHSWDGDSEEEGPGAFGSYVYISITRYKVNED
jgi:hypothetical protein